MQVDDARENTVMLRGVDGQHSAGVWAALGLAGAPARD
jgi:hypothetical protein